jgi:hypothetical protein
MRVRLAAFLATIVVTLSPLVAWAQDDPKVGLTMGYPSAVGVLWQLSSRVALRPEFTLARTSIDMPPTIDPQAGVVSAGSTSDSWATGFGLSALFYIGRYDSLRTYVSPRFNYSRSSGSTGLTGMPESSNSDGWVYSTSGSFGAQYGLGRHFAVFGEIGGNYTASTTRTSLVESRTVLIPAGPAGPITSTTLFTVRSDQHSNQISTRSGAGIIFYF